MISSAVLLNILACIIGGLGLVSMIARRTILGILVGSQLFVLGSTMMFVLTGISSGSRAEGHLFGMFITLSGVAQLVAGYALAIRFFYLKQKVSMEDLRTLKQ